jgi:hypothetical protein
LQNELKRPGGFLDLQKPGFLTLFKRRRIHENCCIANSCVLRRAPLQRSEKSTLFRKTTGKVFNNLRCGQIFVQIGLLAKSFPIFVLKIALVFWPSKKEG